MNKSKKIISIVAAATLAFSTLALAGCGETNYKGDALTKDTSAVIASTNGGFLVESGDYVYFINGKEVNTANNTYGKPVKGALMRISKADLAAKKTGAAKIVVPSLFVAGDYTSGIYIYGEYVYYATPTSDKNKDGQVENSYLDFKRAKLDGSEAPMGGKNNYFFRLSSNTTKYRFVEVGGVVYCLYEEDGKLKSHNTADGTTSVLVSGASSYFYNTSDLSDPNVYYTMGVTYEPDKEKPTTAEYNQVYCVNAAATAVVHADKAAYDVYNGSTLVKSYDFDETFMKDNAKDKGYDLKDYTTYPYVNLGSLVLDGVSKQPAYSADKRFNQNDLADAKEFGYSYTLQQQANGGLYFTRTEVGISIESATDTNLYYLPNARGENWNTIKGNNLVDVVSTDTTKASASAVYQVSTSEAGVRSHTYYYTADSMLKKATDKGEKEINLAYGVSSATLWKAEGNYLYYYTSGTNGNNVSRIDCTGEQANYDFLGEDKYDSVTLSLVDWNDSWYKPEFVTVASGEGTKQVLLYANVQSFGSGTGSFDYIYATDVGTNEQILAINEKVEKVNEYIDSFDSNSELQDLMKYYYRTGSTEAYGQYERDGVENPYTDYQQEEFVKFQNMFKENGEFYGLMESNFITAIGKVSESDIETMETAWEDYLKAPEEAEDEDDEKLDTLTIALIVGGITLAFAIVVILTVVLMLKAKKKKAQKAQAIVNAYKHKKIDTTDDKSIDVYAEEETSVQKEEEAAEEE